jgi:hypothetical protein
MRAAANAEKIHRFMAGLVQPVRLRELFAASEPADFRAAVEKFSQRHGA